MTKMQAGEENYFAKITTADVEAIRSAKRQRDGIRKHVQENLSNDALARQYGLSPRTIEKIIGYKIWTHV